MSGTIFSTRTSGTIYSTRPTSDNKLLNIKTICQFDGSNCIVAYYLDDELKFAQISRRFGNIQHLVSIGTSEQTKKPVLQTESHSILADDYGELITKDDRTFMSDWPTAIFFRPAPGLRMSLLDLFDKPAFRLKLIKKTTDGSTEYVQIEYSIDQTINEKQSNDNKIF